MSGRNGGGVLILALVSVSVISLVYSGLAIWLSRQSAVSMDICAYREDCAVARELLRDYAINVLGKTKKKDLDIRGILARQYSNEDISPKAVVVSPNNEETAGDCGPLNEERLLPVNNAPSGTIANLLVNAAGMDRKRAEAAEKEILSLRPFTEKEEMLLAKSLPTEAFHAISPFITVFGTSGIDIDTAPMPVLAALFDLARKYDPDAAQSLLAKIAAFRKAGGRFDRTDAAYIAQRLGGLGRTEVQILAAAEGRLTAESRFMSGKSISGSAAILFTYDLEEEKFVRTAFFRTVGN